MRKKNGASGSPIIYPCPRLGTGRYQGKGGMCFSGKGPRVSECLPPSFSRLEGERAHDLSTVTRHRRGIDHPEWLGFFSKKKTPCQETNLKHPSSFFTGQNPNLPTSFAPVTLREGGSRTRSRYENPESVWRDWYLGCVDRGFGGIRIYGPSGNWRLTMVSAWLQVYPLR
jgi:hypothetical protein